MNSMVVQLSEEVFLADFFDVTKCCSDKIVSQTDE